MGTPAIIKVEGSEVCLYKHWDGGVEYTLPWLTKFNKEFTENRGNDVDYKVAQLIRSSVLDAAEFGLDSSKFTGWGVMVYNSNYDTDVNYVYTLHIDGSVSHV